MNKLFSGRRLRFALPILGVFASLGVAWAVFVQPTEAGRDTTVLLEKMVVTDGTVVMNLDLGSAAAKVRPQTAQLRFNVAPDGFFTAMVANDEFRAMLPGSMPLGLQEAGTVPTRLQNSLGQLAVVAPEVLDSTGFGLVVRDASTGFPFFNLDRIEYAYTASARSIAITDARVLLSNEFAQELGRPALTDVGSVSISLNMRPIEITTMVNGEVASSEMPALREPEAGTRPGPDVVVGDLHEMGQNGSSGTQVGIQIGTVSCNYGQVNLNWFQNPSNDHPVIPQNVYRMSGGADNAQTMEQIGQSWVKHAFTALTQNVCGLGCNGVGGSQLGSGCSDPYSASLNGTPSLGSRALINPFTGFYPQNASANNNHTGHTHTGPIHRALVEQSDLNPTLNPGATYYAEGQYVTPHEYAWCQANPTQCNMFNNASYRRFTPSGTTSFSFSFNGATVREKAAIEAWTGATIVPFRPSTQDGMGMVGYKVTETSPGVWHYEYAVYNMNLERAIQSFGVPQGSGVTLTNVGFHAPPQHPGWAFDGTDGNAGFSSAPWTTSEQGGYMYWSTDPVAVSANANAIRWGTMYNFRFDSNKPPMLTHARLGFFKTGEPISVLVQAPQGGLATCSRVPQGNRC